MGFGGAVALLPIAHLRPHERTLPKKRREIQESISSSGVFRGPPILVESEHFIILDGHHRTAALKSLGCLFIPAILVSYSSVRVKPFSGQNLPRLKSLVIETALSGRLLPPKTTKHVYEAPEQVEFSVSFLKGQKFAQEENGSEKRK
jgi:hypothetical protein